MKQVFSIAIQTVFAVLICSSNLCAQNLADAIKQSNNEQFESASNSFAKLLAGAANAENYFYCGENFFKAGDLDSAMVMYQKGKEVASENPINTVGLGKVMWFKNDSAAKSLFAEALAVSKAKSALVLYKIAEAYITADKKNLSEAFILLNLAVKLEPKNPEIYILMGDAFLEQNNGSQAILQYEKANELDVKSTKAILRIGQLYVRTRNTELANEYYDKANAIDSTFAPAFREKAELYYQAQLFDKAIAQYKKYLHLNNNLSARIRYASFLFLNKQYANAIVEINEIQKRDTSKVVLYRLLGYSYFETGEYAKGMSNINTFFERLEKSKIKVLPSDYQYQGKLLSKTGQDSLAVLVLTRAISLDSTQIDLYNDLGTVQYKLKRYPDAIASFEKRIALRNGGSVNDFNALGRAYYFNKEYKKADSVFAKIVEAKPELVLGYFWRARSNSKMDPDLKSGASKTYYEAFIERASIDPVKNKKDLIEAYSYMGSFFGLAKDFASAKIYFAKVLELDSESAAAKTFMSSKEAK